MPKPPLTDEQKKSFEVKFKELISKEEAALKSWDGEFYWLLDKPKLDNVVKLFSARSKDKYQSYLIRLDNRTI
jgi:hypothetical protein